MTTDMSAASSQRAERLFRDRYREYATQVDRLFAYVMAAQWVLAIVFALLVSPYSWEGRVRSVHVHIYIAIFLGGAISAMPIALVLFRPGWGGTRYVVAVAQMLWSALLIHLTGGRVETHFHVFGSLAFLAFYRDWKVLAPATAIVAADHLVRQLFWPESVYGVMAPEWWRFLEHAGWVVFEDIILFIACLRATGEMRELARQHIQIEVQERAAAAKIQTSIIPRDVHVDGLEVAMKMEAAEVVGGDFYDVLPVDGGCWIAIGDVSGHGVRAGLTMLQAQSALGALVRHDPQATPGMLWSGLNRLFVANVRQRLQQREHMTMSLLRYHHDGRFEAFGAHEEIVIWRARTKRVEVLPIEGTWIGLTTGALANQAAQTFQLEPGDLLVLYTDGIIEARDRSGSELGIDGLQRVIADRHHHPVSDICASIFASTDGLRDDDASVMVFRYTGITQLQATAA